MNFPGVKGPKDKREQEFTTIAVGTMPPRMPQTEMVGTLPSQCHKQYMIMWLISYFSPHPHKL